MLFNLGQTDLEILFFNCRKSRTISNCLHFKNVKEKCKNKQTRQNKNPLWKIGIKKEWQKKIYYLLKASSRGWAERVEKKQFLFEEWDDKFQRYEISRPLKILM